MFRLSVGGGFCKDLTRRSLQVGHPFDNKACIVLSMARFELDRSSITWFCFLLGIRLEGLGLSSSFHRRTRNVGHLAKQQHSVLPLVFACLRTYFTGAPSLGPGALPD